MSCAPASLVIESSELHPHRSKTLPPCRTLPLALLTWPADRWSSPAEAQPPTRASLEKAAASWTLRRCMVRASLPYATTVLSLRFALLGHSRKSKDYLGFSFSQMQSVRTSDPSIGTWTISDLFFREVESQFPSTSRFLRSHQNRGNFC